MKTSISVKPPVQIIAEAIEDFAGVTPDIALEAAQMAEARLANAMNKCSSPQVTALIRAQGKKIEWATLHSTPPEPTGATP